MMIKRLKSVIPACLKRESITLWLEIPDNPGLRDKKCKHRERC